MSSTLIELMSTINTLKSTTTGPPFGRAGRISIKRREKQMKTNFL